MTRRGLRRGILEGSRAWMAVGIAAGLVAIVRRVVAQPPETVYRQALHPGEGVLIRVHEPERARD